MSSPSPDRHVRLRNPALLFGSVAPLILFVIALFCASFINTGFSAHAPVAARGLFTPAVIGLALTVVAIGPRVRRGQIAARLDLIRRAAIGFAVAGFVWPLSFGIAVALQGDTGAFVGSLLPAVLGLLVGGFSGAVGGAVATYTCFRKA